MTDPKIEPQSPAAMTDPSTRSTLQTLITSMVGLERWSRRAPSADPLKRAFDQALNRLRVQQLASEDAAGPQLRELVRRLRTVGETDNSALHVFALIYLRETIGAEAVDELKGRVDDPEEDAYARACSTWEQLVREFEKVRLGPGGRPRSFVPEALNALHEEIQRSPLVGEDLKRRGIHAIAEWAARVSGKNAETVRKAIERVRGLEGQNPLES